MKATMLLLSTLGIVLGCLGFVLSISVGNDLVALLAFGAMIWNAFNFGTCLVMDDL